MQSRKLVKSGNTSFTITLPIDWVRKNGLDAGSEVDVEENPKGQLLLSAHSQHQPASTPQPEQIDISGKTPEQIELEITIQYIRDSPSVVLTGEYSSHVNDSVRDVVNDLIGFETIDQSPQSITIKNFFDLDQETSPQSISTKMFHVNRTFFTLLEGFFSEGLSQQEVHEAEQFMQQNYKLSYVAEKGILLAMQAPDTAKQLRTNPLALLKQKRYVQASRNISAYLHSISELFSRVDRQAPGVELLEEHFSSLMQRHDVVARSIRNFDAARLRELLIEAWDYERRIEECVPLLDSGLLVQAATLLFAINQDLGDITYESLL